MSFSISTPKVVSLALLALVAGSANAFADQAAVNSCVSFASDVCGSGELFQSVLATVATDCKNLESGSKKTRYQVYQLSSGDVLTVGVKAARGNENLLCRFKLFDLSAQDPIREEKVEGNKAYFRGDNGGGYFARLEGNSVQFYELLSRPHADRGETQGKPYRFSTGSGVRDLVGTGRGEVTFKLSDGNERKIDSSDVQDNLREGRARERDFPEYSVRNIWDLIRAIQSPPPPMAAESADEAVAPPPPEYDYAVRDAYAPSSIFGITSTSLADCEGQMTVERYASNKVKVSFTAGNCSRVDVERIDGQSVDFDGQLNTDYKPYTGAFYITGDGYRTSNKARVVLHSKSRATGVKVYVHF